MNAIDYEFFSLIKKFELLDRDDIYLNIKNRYLDLSSELKNNIEIFLNNFLFWGRLDYRNNVFEEINNKADFLKNNLDELVILYQRLKDYKSKKILLAIIKNYYLYDFKLLSEVRDNCYKHYFDLDLVKANKNSIYVDVGSYIGDSVSDFLSSYLENYKRIYCYEVTPDSISKLKDSFIFNKDIIIREKALLDKDTKVALNNNHIDNSANKIEVKNGGIEAVTLDHDIKEKVDIIKMDIEGAEEKAILGSRRHIINDHPTLMISIYHGFNDLVRLPLLINRLNPNYDFYLRYYGGSIFPTEIVLIALAKTK